MQRAPIIKEYDKIEDFIENNRSELISNDRFSTLIDVHQDIFQTCIPRQPFISAELGSWSERRSNPLPSPSISPTIDPTSASTSGSGMNWDRGIVGGVEMMAMQSQISDISNLSVEQNISPHTSDQSLASANDFSNNLSKYGQLDISPCGNDSSLQPFSFSTAVAPSLLYADLEEDLGMGRLTSTESSASSQSTRVQKRRSEVVQSERPIAPKLPEEQLANSRQLSSPQLMKRIQSADGSSREVMPITKNSYNRPVREKMTCFKCKERPGFRGEHELKRHDERAHSTKRKVWVCIDASPDKSKLSKCAKCRQRKTYNAYYNAAAHLRRVHFNPKPKGKKNKHDFVERRGGSGGGSKPTMEFLKDWMEEIEEPVFDGPKKNLCATPPSNNPTADSDMDSDSATPISIRPQSPSHDALRLAQQIFATDGNEFSDMSFFTDSHCNFVMLDLGGSVNDPHALTLFPDPVLQPFNFV